VIFPMIWMQTRHYRQQIARVIVKHGYCGSCGYSLTELEAAGDGCTVCPECGSAWRRSAPAGVNLGEP
jgi:predicted Zn-ribbon and HTH transcriptional regulator